MVYHTHNGIPSRYHTYRTVEMTGCDWSLELGLELEQLSTKTWRLDIDDSRVTELIEHGDQASEISISIHIIIYNIKYC